ncbi:hypothetical protein [Telmatospirillum sp.]|uniref:hypothetical protein n=1 Tax=Telmatospirillum sp. TaxID=2079197 RepID=UPI002842035A|nr:hypothetical protein [Telmatospirillum sp.]MDR3437319.1 hypothetical protein [Telmatospirillum sp.]
MPDDGFIDLTGEDRLWRAHRVGAVVLLVLLAIHLTLRLPLPASPPRAVWTPLGDWAEDAVLLGLLLVAPFHVVVGIRHLRRLCPILWPRPGQRHFLTLCIAAERYSGLALAGFLAIHLCLVVLAETAFPDLDVTSQ